MSSSRTLRFALIVSLCTPCLAQTQVQVGDEAPPITVDVMRNAPMDGPVPWQQLANKTVVIEFWGTWCGPCVAAIPHMNELYEDLHDEDVVFLSVTFEDPQVVDRLVKIRPLKGWIGCDMDRSMVNAYGVTSWPTTFVVRNGTVVDRTRPSSLTADMIRAYTRGETAATVRPEQRELMDEVVGEDGRPPMGSLRPGQAPYSRLDETPVFQIIVRKAGEASASASTATGATLIGQPVTAVVAQLWDLPSYAVEGDSWSTETRFDVIYLMPFDLRSDYLPIVRDIVTRALGAEVELLAREVEGVSLRVAEGGIKLHEGVIDRAGWMSGINSAGNHTLAGASMEISDLTPWLASLLGKPVVDDTKLEGRFFVDLAIPPDDLERVADILKERCGLVMAPSKMQIEVAKVSRMKDN